MIISTTAKRAITAYFLLVGSCFGIVNHTPAGTAQAPEARLERQREGLDRVLSAEFAGIPSFPYWDHVGMVGMGSGIYLGDGCVLTSAHVGCFPFRMHDGSIYQPDYASWRVLQNG